MNIKLQKSAFSQPLKLVKLPKNSSISLAVRTRYQLLKKPQVDWLSIESHKTDGVFQYQHSTLNQPKITSQRAHKSNVLIFRDYKQLTSKAHHKRSQSNPVPLKQSDQSKLTKQVAFCSSSKNLQVSNKVKVKQNSQIQTQENGLQTLKSRPQILQVRKQQISFKLNLQLSAEQSPGTCLGVTFQPDYSFTNLLVP